jgi:hypothetical protein
MKDKTAIRAEIGEIELVLARVRTDLRGALADIAQNGVPGIVSVLDSNGKEIRKKGLNPAVQVVARSGALERQLLKRLRSLEEALKTAEVEESRHEFVEFQDSRVVPMRERRAASR